MFGVLRIRDYQWNDVAVPFWKKVQAYAADHDVKVCLEMHPGNVVFNPRTLERLVTEIGATHVGAELDPSHLFWQGIDPVEAVRSLGGLVYNAAAKDTRINPLSKVNGNLDDDFSWVAKDDPRWLSLGRRSRDGPGRSRVCGLQRQEGLHDRHAQITGARQRGEPAGPEVRVRHVRRVVLPVPRQVLAELRGVRGQAVRGELLGRAGGHVLDGDARRGLRLLRLPLAVAAGVHGDVVVLFGQRGHQGRQPLVLPIWSGLRGLAERVPLQCD